MVGGGGKGGKREGELTAQKEYLSHKGKNLVIWICTLYMHTIYIMRDERRKEERSKQTCTGSQSPVVS